MRLHNTLSRQVENFEPAAAGKVRMYSCGPTVYDHAHIGNLSSYIYADTLRRVLAAAGNQIQHVMNITDIDDKMIKRSRELYPDDSPESALKRLAADCTQLFLDDMQAVGNDLTAMKLVSATDHIDQMRRLISELYEAGFAYVADDGVYFAIDKYRAAGKTYGQLSEINPNSTAEARIQNDEYDKEAAHDFALWKTRKPGEPAWDFELGGHNLLGRPGWHIECSAMSTHALGQPFDIHTGGVDLIFPHHENEIAQSTAVKYDVMANFFVHNEHLLVDGRKMSKSLNNFYTLQDIRERGFDPLAFRLLVLQSHYRSQSNFSWKNLEAAQNRLKHWRSAAALSWQTGSHAESKIETGILRAGQNDLDTPSALAAVDRWLSVFEDDGLSANHDSIVRLLDEIRSVLGIDLATKDIETGQKELLAQRRKAREARDWAKSDEIRDALSAQGIGVRDTADGQVWFRL